jgi:hypothetical protein
MTTTTKRNPKSYSHRTKVMAEKINTTEEIIGIHKEIKNLNSKIDRILRTLIGDEEMAQEGLVNKVDRHDKYIESQKLIMAKIMGVAIGSGLFGGIVGQILIEYLIK